MIPLRKKIQHKNLDGYPSVAGEKVRVSFPGADDIIDRINKNTIIARLRDLDKPPSSRQKAEDLQIEQAASSPSTTGVSRRNRPSSRIDSLAKPLARLQKPSIRLNAVFRGVEHQLIPWSKKGPKVPNEKPPVAYKQMISQLPRTKTGVSRAALKYEASEHIKRLAKHRPKPKTNDAKKCFSVKPLSLIYKPSLRILQLSKPRNRTLVNT